MYKKLEIEIYIGEEKMEENIIALVKNTKKSKKTSNKKEEIILTWE